MNSKILNFKAWSHLANNDPQTREQRAIIQIKVMRCQANRNLNKLIELKLMLQNAR